MSHPIDPDARPCAAEIAADHWFTGLPADPIDGRFVDVLHRVLEVIPAASLPDSETLRKWLGAGLESQVLVVRDHPRCLAVSTRIESQDLPSQRTRRRKWWALLRHRRLCSACVWWRSAFSNWPEPLSIRVFGFRPPYGRLDRRLRRTLRSERFEVEDAVRFAFKVDPTASRYLCFLKHGGQEIVVQFDRGARRRFRLSA